MRVSTIGIVSGFLTVALSGMLGPLRGPGLSVVSVAHHSALQKPLDWQFAEGEADKPAVLLVHGLWQDANSTWKTPSEALPTPVGNTRAPGAVLSRPSPEGRLIPAVTSTTRRGKPVSARFDMPSLSDEVVNSGNWFDALEASGFTVASWSQGRGKLRGPLKGARSLRAEVPSALAALALLAEQTAKNESPIALIGHSRGGLLIRMMIKALQRDDPDELLARVRWVVTLHTPHQGSALASICGGQSGEELFSKVREALSSTAAIDHVPGLGLALELWPDLANSLCEMDPKGELLERLQAGEWPAEGVDYYTFGGTYPTFMKLYKYVCNEPRSLRIPALKNWKFDLVGEVAKFPPEARGGPFDAEWGTGDGLVSEVSSHLPFEAAHFNYPLNHLEVLFDKKVQEQVMGLLRMEKSRRRR